jgi:hypothetical protein
MLNYNQTEALLILSGIASEASMKTKGYLEPSLYTSIFEAYQHRTLKLNDIKSLSYTQIATVVWANTIVKIQGSRTQEFWSQVLDHLESLISYQTDLQSGLYHTIIIAKGLSSVDPNLTRCP